uniref:Uncharacterized protein n=1 Tax=Magallana gigas TaxID=29159 RepID=K1QP86_MAGGI
MAEEKKTKDVTWMEMMNNLRQHSTNLAAVHEELVIRVEEKDKMKKIRALILTEMMLRFMRMAEAKKTRAVIWLEIMDHILEKPNVDEEFVPRKLFLFGVDYFNISPEDKDTANDQEKPRRRTLRDRVKKFFGIK